MTANNYRQQPGTSRSRYSLTPRHPTFHELRRPLVFILRMSTRSGKSIIMHFAPSFLKGFRNVGSHVRQFCGAGYISLIRVLFFCESYGSLIHRHRHTHACRRAHTHTHTHIHTHARTARTHAQNKKQTKNKMCI